MIFSPSDALSGNGALLDYLHILKELKSEVNHIQEFIDAHIELLEKISQSQDRSPDKGCDIVLVDELDLIVVG